MSNEQGLGMPSSDHALTVSQLTSLAREALESAIGHVWIQGELSNLARPGSGHMYLSLKDGRSQIRCAMFRTHNSKLNFTPKDGDQVLVYGAVSIYEARGDFQLIIEKMQPLGAGALQREFELLKNKLAGEGLFENDRKSPLPIYPSKIGIITSPTAAALQDIKDVLKRRAPMIPLRLYPAMVQGIAAPGELIDALKLAIDDTQCDVLIIARGGGSIEDLWAFNHEELARLVAKCPIPIVSGVGHEIDFTIVDFVADQRAPTPSAAAELVSPDAEELKHKIHQMQLQLKRLWQIQHKQNTQQLTLLKQQLKTLHPRVEIQQQQQRVDELLRSIKDEVNDSMRMAKETLQDNRYQLQQYSPVHQLQVLKSRVDNKQAAAIKYLAQRVEQEKTNITRLQRSMTSLAPQATLQRGYAIIRDENDQVITRKQDVKTDSISAELADGRLFAKVRKDS